MSTTTIKTNLTGDASGLVAAAQSAANAMGTLSERKIAMAARAKEAYMSELAAIRLQAGGYNEVADQIRTVAAAREEAHKLASKANIPITEATKLVNEQAAAQARLTANIQRQAQAQAKAASEAAQAAASAATAYAAQSREVNASLNAQKANALAASAAAAESKAAAAAARDAAAALDIQRQKALAGIAASRAAAIANPRATGLPALAGGGLAPLTPSMLTAMDRHTAQTRELSRQQGNLTGSTKNSALGFLAFSQALEDSQYGIKGVLNNIPQMIMGFGMGAGVAGAISIAAVAAVALYPALKRLTGAMETEKLNEYIKSLQELTVAGRAAARKDYDAVVLAREMVAFGEELTEKYRQRLSLGTDMVKVYEGEITASKQLAEHEAKIADLKTRTAAAEGRDVSKAPQIAHEKELADIQAETVKRKQIEIKTNDDIAAKRTQQAAIEQENAKRIIALEKERLKLQERIEEGQAAITSTKARRDKSKENQPGYLDVTAGLLADATGASSAYSASEKLQGGEGLAGNFYIRHKETLRQAVLEQKKLSDNITISTNSLKRNEAALAASTGRQTELNKAGADAVTTLKAEIDALNTKLQLNDTEIKQLATKTAQLKETKKETDKLRDAESAREARSRDPRQGGYFGGETADETAARIAEQQKEKAGAPARQDLATELDMLKLQQQGRSKIAEELGKEVELRKEAKSLAEKTNRSEEEMLATLREINAQKKDLSDARRSPAEARADRAKERAEGKDRRIRDARAKNRLGRPQIPRTNEEKRRAKEREGGQAVRDEQDKRNKAADLGKADEEAKKGWGKLISTQEKLAVFLEELSKI